MDFCQRAQGIRQALQLSRHFCLKSIFLLNFELLHQWGVKIWSASQIYCKIKWGVKLPNIVYTKSSMFLLFYNPTPYKMMLSWRHDAHSSFFPSCLDSFLVTGRTLSSKFLTSLPSPKSECMHRDVMTASFCRGSKY